MSCHDSSNLLHVPPPFTALGGVQVCTLKTGEYFGQLSGVNPFTVVTTAPGTQLLAVEAQKFQACKKIFIFSCVFI
jgi:hypothetical protein